ncbi:DUF1513 domain-containing protein [Psychrobacter sp. FDAARGOS_221]|uniref:DUF1513 domain-containing protein n=1 Tax=Psychrobacter sp. FDAARGOS_221 TaxID=1975705 RepID=UPI000BB55155|nr:DUF1513 domain-containing protein [Psychrobacter sp. FDAARGOS_221]PNK61008.1 DUF1513 domain-containing protein [Psychrobacter sp. FDAARGOS_221]
MSNRSVGAQSAKAVNTNEYGQTQLETGLRTLALTSLGTAALVTAHHLGRKQYNPDARLSDYMHGVLDVVQRKLRQDVSDLPTQSGSDSNEQQLALSKDGLTADTQAQWVSGVAQLQTSEFAVVGINAQRDMVWQTPMPERVHDIVIQPQALQQSVQQVTVMGRRPSQHFWVLDAQTGEVIHSIKSQKDRHFYGHACYSLAGDRLYVTENNTDDFSGVIGVYDVALGYKKIAEFATHGIGPHELVMHPDGDTLVIANGGIKTEKASREELNIDSMQPSLVYLNRHNGELIQQIYPEHNQMSVRHLAMHEDGTVVIGIQFQGERHLSVPLVLTHKLGQESFTPLQMTDSDTKGWHRFHHYIASVAVDSTSNLVCATSPIGGCAALFDLRTGLMLGEVDLPDCAGAALWSHNSKLDHDSPQFLVSDGKGQLTSIGLPYQQNEQGELEFGSITVDKVARDFAFDNHLNTL